MFEDMNEQEAREHILKEVAAYCDRYHKKTESYKPGDRISYAGRLYDREEMVNLTQSALEFWLTSGSFTQRFEKELAEMLGVRFVSLVNSGSSANLLAFMALTSSSLGERRILPGDEVITVAAGFPTTVTPIVQYGAIPVFVDVTIPQYNLDVTKLEEALSNKTKAVMIAHTLGNPFDVTTIRSFCDRNNLWLIEDNCDALGSVYELDGRSQLTGTFGDIGTSSFYPPHHITMGEGGAVYTNDPRLNKLMRSMRDWGRDCVCASGQDNLCQHRFEGQFGELPQGYDHKYIYSQFGYNLKATDMQAAIGCAQLQKLPGFVEKRRKNWEWLRNALADLEEFLILPEPCPQSEPSWFGFLMTVRQSGLRDQIVEQLEESNVQTRMLFAGNLIRHPCFDEMRSKQIGFRVVGTLNNTDRIMRDSFWIGVYPGMTEEMLNVMAQCVRDAVLRNAHGRE